MEKIGENCQKESTDMGKLVRFLYLRFRYNNNEKYIECKRSGLTKDVVGYIAYTTDIVY